VPARYHFFLSYARGDDDQFVRRFSEDLSAEIRVLAGLDADEQVGFLDVSAIGLGDNWSQRLVDALSACHTFVALVSPRYLLSEPCGKEWAAFSRRLAADGQAGTRVPALLPLIWLPPRRLPAEVTRLRYSGGALPDEYHRIGLRQFLRLARHRETYLEIVAELARHIVDAARQPPPPPLPPGTDFDGLPDAFRSAAPDTGHVPAPRPPRRPAAPVRFLVAAPTLADLDTPALVESRPRRDYYGDRAVDWAPYRPGLPEPLVGYARRLAGERRLDADAADLAAPGRPPRDWLDGGIAVLLLDVWALRLPRYVSALAERGGMLHAVLVPANREDLPTQREWRDAGGDVRSAVGAVPAAGDNQLFRPGVLTHEAFAADLGVILEVARNRLGGRPRSRSIMRIPVLSEAPDEPEAT
jgi:FxsC-like protein